MKNQLAVAEIKVGLNTGGELKPLGRLAAHERKIYFEYNSAFISTGLEISPFHLPLKSGVSSFDPNLFEGLPGVFNDSLPDGWGRLLFDRYARSCGILPSEITPLTRLAHIGHHGMGALVYEPDHSTHDTDSVIVLDRLAEQAQEVLNGSADDVLQELLNLNGSSAGARPKALIGLDLARQSIIHGARELPVAYEPWMVKFSNFQDGADAGAIEYVYALMAFDAGLIVPDVHLFPAQKGAGYFAIKRFDRNGEQRLHMHSASGLLHSDFRVPSLDYEDLIALTGRLTRDVREVEKMYRLAVFNVLAHNRDDHAKNFSFLMNSEGQWHLSPAYDLTFSSGPRGEQSTMVMGEGRKPGVEHLVKLGESAKIAKARIREIIDQTHAALSHWPVLAGQYGVSQVNRQLIADFITPAGSTF
jgi:serine/threonine-protein kinase HipA